MLMPRRNSSSSTIRRCPIRGNSSAAPVPKQIPHFFGKRGYAYRLGAMRGGRWRALSPGMARQRSAKQSDSAGPSLGLLDAAPEGNASRGRWPCESRVVEYNEFSGNDHLVFRREVSIADRKGSIKKLADSVQGVRAPRRRLLESRGVVGRVAGRESASSSSQHRAGRVAKNRNGESLSERKSEQQRKAADARNRERASLSNCCHKLACGFARERQAGQR